MLYNAKNPHGGDVYGGDVTLDFSANTNPYGTSERVVEAMGAVLRRTHQYPDPYCRELVAAIAEYEDVPKSYVLCGNGAAELIYSFCEAARPSVALELAPTFSEYSLGLERVGCEVRRFSLKKDEDFRLGEDFLAFLEGEKFDALFLCSPNNPTGQVVEHGLLVKIMEACAARGARLFLDECFLQLSDETVSMKGFLGEFPNLFILKAFTKSYGMAGVRLGYCLSADGELLSRMSAAVQPWNVSTIAQAAGVAALGDREFLNRARQVIPGERRWLAGELRRLGFWVCPSSANYLLFEGPTGLDERLRQRGIAVRNCSNYHGLGEGWFRVAVRLREENERLVQGMEGALGGH